MTAAASPPLAAQSLTSWAVLPGGNEICLSFAASAGENHRIVLPLDALTALLMTMPRMLQAAIEERFPGVGCRVVYPLDLWRLEQAEGGQGFILRLATPDGFEVAFAVREENASALGTALATARERIATDAAATDGARSFH